MVQGPRMGRVVYMILVLAILVVLSTYGAMELWPRVESYRAMRALNRRWHDASLSSSARSRAAEMLAEYGPDASDYLLAAARDRDSRVREVAYGYLAGISPIPDEVVPICLTALQDEGAPGRGPWRCGRSGRSPS